jgi:GNAT superfamily N-acetyltransferase/catechol 2,3-dioxygenase-like lactoylglutathione lyase family enzyme
MDQQPDPYRIRLARADEASRLRQIEDEAGTLFSGLGLIDEALDVSFPLDDLARLVSSGQVWVACLPDGLPVGMVIASVREGAVYVEEMDVLPAHGRRGIGSRLLERVCEWAEEEGHSAVTLSTFRDVPWNGPFYRRHGFRDLKPAEWTPGMRAIREREAQNGLRVDARVFMRRELGAMGTPEPSNARWPEHLPVGALRVVRSSLRYDETVVFYRDTIGLPVLETFRDSYGQDGTILGLPGRAVHLEILRLRDAPPRTPGRDQLVFYLPDAADKERILARLASAGFHPVEGAGYWEANGGVIFPDPDGREVVFAPWIYGPSE